MPRDFLPPASPGTSYPVTATTGRFAEGDAQLLSHIGANMAVAEAQTEGRVPSPLSRAYMFYTALFGRSLAMTGNQSASAEDQLQTAGRRALHAQARNTFRGLCAVFALREALGLEVELRAIPLVQSADSIARVLGPSLEGAPGGAAYWQHVRLLTVRPQGGGEAEVLAGLSPLTGVFPAANPPARALAGVFWYTPPTDLAPTGRWHDPTGTHPTGSTTPLSPQTQTVVRAALAEWVRHVLAGYSEDVLKAQGVTARGAQLLRVELEAWKDDLAAVPPVAGVGVVAGAIPAPAGQPVPPFLLATSTGVGSVVRSDLPLHHGQLVVSSGSLGDPTQRVWGGVFGDRGLRDRAAALPRSGRNLGAALGLGDAAAPVPFVVLDKLFTPTFTILTRNGLSDGWRGLPVGDRPTDEFALFPFETEILELLTPDELAVATTAELSQDTLNYKVRLTVGDQEVVQLYAISGEGDYGADLEVSADTVDVRLFPDFDLGAVRDVLPANSDGSRPDERYYARVRLGPEWSFAVQALHLDDGAEGDRRTVTAVSETARRGSTTAAAPGAMPSGEAAFFTLDRTPDGFWFEGRGLCLVHLRRPSAADFHPQTWNVAVDFGTSNSCVAYRPADGSDAARPFEFPVLTTTLLRNPTPVAMGHVNEGSAAALDFFYKLGADGRDLVSPTQYPDAATPYFPTQIVTLQTELPGGASDFDLSSGLILFQNGILSGMSLIQIIDGFNVQTEGTGTPLTQRFYLRQDIKWKQRAWLRAFMAHLRLQVVLTAANRNARVNTALFSYPKAFNDQDETAYETALRATWGQLYGGLTSESEAVRTTLGGTANQNIVLDIGGGTTDVIAFHAGAPVFQTSFKVASGQINDYVVASAPFRSAFRKAVSKAEMGGRGLDLTLGLFDQGSETQLLNVWVGLLQSLEYDDLSGRTLTAVTSALAEAARGDDAEAQAVRGFFLTTALLFGGLAYSTGRLLGLAAQGRLDGDGFPLVSVQVTLTGNGSKLVNLLSSERVPIDGVFTQLFERGLGGAAPGGDGQATGRPSDDVRIRYEGVYTLGNGVAAPKTTVALGLLAGAGGDPAGEVPVANVLLEDVGDEAASDSLIAFYSQVARNASAFVPGTTAPPELAAFLDAMNEALPNGHNGKRMVIPGVGPDWHEPLKTRAFAQARGAVLDRLRENARDLPAGAETAAGAAYVPALEPVLIAEIAALLDQIREDYA